MTRQLAGDKEEQSYQPALVEIEDALVPAFIIEKHTDGQLTVFVSSSPTPMAGAIYILSPERVHPVDVPLHKAIVCVTKWGAGAAEMRAAMRPRQDLDKNSLTSEKTKETSSQADRYFLESVRQHHLGLNARWVHEFENIKCIEGDLFMLSATFKF